jgi:DnaJ-class molecular chaperone
MGRGDLIFTVKQKPHPTFKRVGNNLFFDMHLNLQESLLGFSKTLTHLDGRIVTVKSDTNEII